MKRRDGGFVLIEFAIALPLLILIAWGLASVTAKIFYLSKNQLADYVLETEAQYVIERVTQRARAASSITVEREEKYNLKIDKIELKYRAVNDDPENANLNVADVLERQIFVVDNKKLHAKRIDDGASTSPITGDNYFGGTQINLFHCDLNETEKILHVTLEMESLISGHKIKINTAVFMPGYGS